MSNVFRRDYGVYCCPHVFKNERPILLIVREDNDWQFLCGQGDHDDKGHFVAVGHIIDRDPEMAQWANLDKNCGVERKKVGKKWIHFKL